MCACSYVPACLRGRAWVCACVCVCLCPRPSVAQKPGALEEKRSRLWECFEFQYLAGLVPCPFVQIPIFFFFNVPPRPCDVVVHWDPIENDQTGFEMNTS